MVLHEDELNGMLDKHVLAGAIKKVCSPGDNDTFRSG